MNRLSSTSTRIESTQHWLQGSKWYGADSGLHGFRSTRLEIDLARHGFGSTWLDMASCRVGLWCTQLDLGPG
ncbi:hypothetical protein PHAVU_009G067033 [Phaseolus vulgaris]